MDLTSEALQAFTKRVEEKVQPAQEPERRHHAAKLKPGDVGEAKRQKHIGYLTEAFEKIAKLKESGCLESLTLRVLWSVLTV